MHLYVHVPFCKQACHYCDFHFSTQLSYRDRMVAAMASEVGLKSQYLREKTLETLYFGGGTPSLLRVQELDLLLNAFHKHYDLSAVKEFTLEANPDDISKDSLALWKSRGISRISLGIQTFNETFLQFMNRAHSGKQGVQALDLLMEGGFETSSVDLIYAKTGYHLDEGRQAAILEKDLAVLNRYPLQHVSAYHLTIEAGTVFSQWKLAPVTEDYSVAQYELVTSRLSEMGFEQYEVSNFARNGNYAVHNTAYWQGHEYLGIGPSAHSFDGGSRQWNVAHNHKYMRGVEAGAPDFEKETLTRKEKLNDYLLTGLRTKWGVSLKEISRIYADIPAEFRDTLTQLLKDGSLLLEEEVLTIPPASRLLSDRIAAELFVVD